MQTVPDAVAAPKAGTQLRWPLGRATGEVPRAALDAAPSRPQAEPTRVGRLRPPGGGTLAQPAP